jgi:hypothetical protein
MTLDSDLQLRQLAAEVADQLSDGWQPDTKRNSDWGHGAHLRQGQDPDAPSLALYGEDWRASSKGRIRITGSWPPDRHPYPYGLHTPSIGVAICRGAETIAKEITGRLLPAYREGLAKVIANNDQDRRDTAQMHAAAERLADTLRPFAQQVWVREWGRTDLEVHGYLDVAGAHRTADAKVNHNGTEVTVELRNLSVDAAVQVFRALEAAAALEAAKQIPTPPRRALTTARQEETPDSQHS